MYNALFQTHKISVILFLLLYLVKTILLLAGKKELLQKITKATKVPEMIISFLFLATGIYMLTQVPEIKAMLIIKIVIVLASIPIAIIGFKKQNKALAALSLVMIIAAYGMAEMAKKSAAKEAPVAVGVSGKEIYDTKCAMCHGADGKLGTMGAKDLTQSSLDNAGIIDIITNGKGAMVGFKGALSDDQITDVATYVEELKK